MDENIFLLCVLDSSEEYCNKQLTDSRHGIIFESSLVESSLASEI
jgi:hypothetical protein